MNLRTYVSLDIGTTSIKVIVAEKIRDQINVLGIGNQKSEGVSKGIIVDIDRAASAIRKAIIQAEEKSGTKISDVIVGLPSNKLKIENCNGIVAISEQSREINDLDVRKVAGSAITKNIPPEREIVDILPDEFIVDGFNGIKDPRGMVGVRLEMRARMITGPKTLIYNTKKAVIKAGLKVKAAVISSLAQGKTILDDGEQDFGSILIELGGGQSTASVIHDHKLKFSTIDNEGGEFITKDISVVLNTSLESAERIKRDYGKADASKASEEAEFPVNIVGHSKPIRVSEKYLSEIIQARLEQILDNIYSSLNNVSALDLPGGIILTGGVAALPDIASLIANKFNTNVRLYFPNQMGLRNPSFSTPLSLIIYCANMSETQIIVRSALNSEFFEKNKEKRESIDYDDSIDSETKDSLSEKEENKFLKSKEKIKNFFNGFFD
ncbi:cell division protein FtsA [Apilactobacillus xinyiensis]|uniref:cell division protein FtsA n=1 Tax=Apilactobacillus xinyiensis TaxID=2841032 RepID=UPI001C7DBD89|nr:cell division protein FtsA [Apilactobacillus xinyiensis]